MRKVILMLATGLLISGCDVAMAATNGEIKLALRDDNASTDWSGKEQDCTIAGVIANYQKGFEVKKHKFSFVGDVNYSQQKNDKGTVVSADDIRLRFDNIYHWRKGLMGCTSIKSLTHLKSDNYVYYYKVGIARANGFDLKGSNTTAVMVAYIAKASASYRMTNSGDSLGILGELDGRIGYGDWSVSVRNASVFVKALDNNIFELPITIEYSPSIVFVDYDILVRGNNQQAGFLRTMKVGVRHQF